MAKHDVARAAALALATGVFGCASAPPEGSLQAIHERALREQMESCLKTNQTTNRYVPLLALVDACERAVYRRSTGRALVH